jgi:hypothetical protein
VKVTLNPRHFHVRAKAADGTIWLTWEKGLLPLRVVKDVTNDVLLCLCADLSAGGETKIIERSIQFSDGFSCKITVEMINDSADCPPSFNKDH